MRNRIIVLAVSLLIGGLLVASPAAAWEVPGDFITSGGWFIIQYPAIPSSTIGSRANFGWHGGVKNGDWWGNGNYIDHGLGLHVHSEQVTGYAKVGTDGTDPQTGQPTGTRDVCGVASTNMGGPFYYRVRLKDTGEPGRRDRFGISLFDSSGNVKYFAYGSLGDPTDGGGNVQLHKHNPSNIAPNAPNDCDRTDRIPDYFTSVGFE